MIGPAQFVLRQAEQSDVEAMYQLDLLCFDARFRFDPATIRHLAFRAKALAFVVQISKLQSTDEVIGFFIADISGSGLKRRAYLSTLDVHPAWRRNGVARMLLYAAETAAGKAGAAVLCLHVYTENHAAICFYENAGYTRQGPAPDYYGPGVSGWIYTHPLPRKEHVEASGAS